MKAVQRANIHNKFDIVVTDAKTKQVKQEVTAYNMVLNAIMMTKTIDLKGGTIMENKEAKTNKTRGPQFSSLEEIFDHIFGDTMEKAQQNHLKAQFKEGAEALWDIYTAFREAGFSESQAMYLCSSLLTSQGGK